MILTIVAETRLKRRATWLNLNQAQNKVGRRLWQKEGQADRKERALVKDAATLLTDSRARQHPN